MSAADRRELAVRAAMAEFALGGYDGTSTWTIARRIGVSQPYMFRLFASKHALFLAAAERCFDDLEGVLRDAAGGLRGDEALDAMARACARLPQDAPALPRLLLKIYAVAVRDADTARLGRVRWARLWRVVHDLTGARPEEIARFLSAGLLVHVLSALGVPYGDGALGTVPATVAAWADGLRGVETSADSGG
ncbi:TetR/AcrR family transcriptional regulator [Actinomadura sp. NAK00032]|uniref:TetR/AcrR family transcriptional regulator n=1 Tax=Actinomadura sp. NAK00032 TaxID=2742128 RepID=UPI001591632A|nr:TetR/AcrR family transcriptional regulator [Actinomadura sp. NAK00032]QKW39361.1 TetR/AcrR family transcriptional regulator [Actinomadura sp. NAK00032]